MSFIIPLINIIKLLLYYIIKKENKKNSTQKWLKKEYKNKVENEKKINK